MGGAGHADVAILQGVLPEYRVPLFEELRKALGDGLVIAAGTEYFQASITTHDPGGLIDVHLTNHYVAGRRLLFQSGYRKAICDATTVVLELNPRVLTTWLVLIEWKLRRRRAVLWGHRVGRRPGDDRPRLGRRLQVKLASAVLAYTYDDAAGLRLDYPGQEVYVAPNATERRTATTLISDQARTDFLYVGRLTAEKQLELLIDGFATARARGVLGANARLVLVGDGPRKKHLADKVRFMSLGDSVVLWGATYAPDDLNQLYATAVAGVCGGYVGLNITQSLSRGVPFVYPAHANHSPEAVVGRVGFNAFCFEAPTPSSVADAMEAAWRATETNVVDHVAIRDQLLAGYSIELMAEGFLKSLTP